MGDVDIEKVFVSKKIYFGEKTINALLVTCTIIIIPWILISKKMTVAICKSKYIEKKVIRHIMKL